MVAFLFDFTNDEHFSSAKLHTFENKSPLYNAHSDHVLISYTPETTLGVE